MTDDFSESEITLLNLKTTKSETVSEDEIYFFVCHLIKCRSQIRNGNCTLATISGYPHLIIWTEGAILQYKLLALHPSLIEQIKSRYVNTSPRNFIKEIMQ